MGFISGEAPSQHTSSFLPSVPPTDFHECLREASGRHYEAILCKTERVSCRCLPAEERFARQSVCVLFQAGVILNYFGDWGGHLFFIFTSPILQVKKKRIKSQIPYLVGKFLNILANSAPSCNYELEICDCIFSRCKLVYQICWTTSGSFGGHFCDGSIWGGLVCFWSVWLISAVTCSGSCLRKASV